MTIQLQRARSINIEFDVREDDGTFLALSAGEKLIFAVKKNENQSTYFIYKELTSEDLNTDGDAYILQLTSEDTNIMSGYYYYDFSLQSNENLYPIVEYEPFVITKSVLEIEVE